MLRLVSTFRFRPKGPLYDPRDLLRRPVRALRGGDDGLAVSFAARSGEIQIELLARGACDDEDAARAIEAARGIAALDDDPTEFYAMARAHPRLAPLARRFDVRLAQMPTVFEAFASAVIEQLVTGYESRNSIKRLTWIAGDAISGTRHRAAPTPAGVRRVPMWKLHAIGIGSRRAATLRTGAMRGEALERLRADPPEKAIEKLMSLRGVGPWTANAVARDALAWADAVPIGDFHAPYVVTTALLGEEGDDAAMVRALEPFRPHRTRVVTLLERGHIAAGRYRIPKVDAHRREPWKY
jgi:3-methyladenine DNA glycosylase/8-oxoguanine DNA glycosylase